MRKLKKSIVGLIGLILLMSFGLGFNQVSAASDLSISSVDMTTENRHIPQWKYVEITRIIYDVPAQQIYYQDAMGYGGNLNFLRISHFDDNPYPENKQWAVYGGLIYRGGMPPPWGEM
ncbi:hypothetical protein [Sporosarcina limicola]|uniref:ABC-type transport system involved in multi-copper enzyme maturation permease subunit n=1 Tax=Sporosarcina limicola TaxID=34101 RepID=A0A927MPJ4_9BACL|nr:hypothetical protein [Sporosarcina limicola]MBE1556912.1 ABC-type transport system involved in multi-copper enzyme maturation permease subunit [Sporosarcina limicola]